MDKFIAGLVADRNEITGYHKGVLKAATKMLAFVVREGNEHKSHSGKY